MNMNKHINKI